MSLKESMPGFFIEKEPSELTNIVVAVDTNLLFSLLTVNQKTFDELYKVLEQLNSKNQLFIPNHVAKEYILDAEDTCKKDGTIYSNVNKKVDAFLSNYDQIKNDYKDRVSDFKLIQDKIDNFNKELKDFINKQLNKPDYPKRRESIEKLFTNIGKPYSRKKLYKLQKEIEFRFSAYIPPGFQDSTKKNGNKYGDCIIWFQLMDYAKKENKDIIYVTIDVKEDWQINNQFRKELYNEFYLETEKKLFIYNPDELISVYNKLTKTKEITTKEDKTDASKSVTELLIDSLPKYSWENLVRPYGTDWVLDSKRTNPYWKNFGSFDLLGDDFNYLYDQDSNYDENTLNTLRLLYPHIWTQNLPIRIGLSGNTTLDESYWNYLRSNKNQKENSTTVKLPKETKAEKKTEIKPEIKSETKADSKSDIKNINTEKKD